MHGLALSGDIRGVAAEKIRQHLTDDAGDVVAIGVKVARARQAVQTGIVLKAGHAIAHELDAALDRAARQLIQSSRHAYDAIHVTDKIALCRQRAL